MIDRYLAAVLILISTVYLTAAFLISEPGAGYATVGPRAFPIAIGIALLACSIWIGLSRTDTPSKVWIDWRSASVSALVVLAYLVIFETAGFLLATAAFVPVQARILGSRALVRDLIVGIVISVSVYGAFSLLLGLRLPAGLFG